MVSPADARLPPVAISRRSQRSSVLSVNVSQKAGSASLRPTRSTLRTPRLVRTSTPALVAAPSTQSTMVAESSVMGNIRPSDSVFSSTPRASNQATVSRGDQRWKAPSSSRPPRG